MKKIFLISVFIMMNIFIFIDKISPSFFISSVIPIFSLGDNKLPSYVTLLDRGKLNHDIFKELPEDVIETVVEIRDEETQGMEDELISTSNSYEVTLDWSNMLKNLTTYRVDINELLSEELNFKLTGNDVEAIVYHTHTTESYTESNDYRYEPSGVYRTLNSNSNMLRIGEETKKYLQQNGIGVYHDKTVYDYPDYNSSYSKAGKGILETLKKYKNAKIVLDLHRDAIGVNTDQYKPVIKIGEKKVAQFLIVVGTNQGGLKHQNWRENLKLALKIKKLADEKYPGLCRNVILRKERFNQQVTEGAIIVEMGATGNTVEEVLETSKYFSELLVEVCK